jgi:hypothetical protein
MAAETPTIVLVHGAWADATGFDAEIRALPARGSDPAHPSGRRGDVRSAAVAGASPHWKSPTDRLVGLGGPAASDRILGDRAWR